MKLNDFLTEQKSFLLSFEGLEYFHKFKEDFLFLYYFIERDYNLCLEKKFSCFDSKTKDDIQEKLNKILNYCLFLVNEEALSKELENFIKNFCIVVFNWNKETYSIEFVNNLTLTIIRYIDLKFTTVELLNILKKFIKKIESIKSLDLHPVDLAKHYLKSLDVKIEKEKENNK